MIDFNEKSFFFSADITYRQHFVGNRVRWFYTSDSVVHQVNLDDVMLANPYILLYERLKDRSSALSPTSSRYEEENKI